MIQRIFREYDVRGLVGPELTPAVAERIGRAFAHMAREQGPCSVLVGRDNRPSSLGLQAGLMTGLVAGGMQVMDLGEVPVPLVYYAREVHGGLPAIMVTGSHNPPAFNGFKLGIGPGTLYGAAIQELGRLAAQALPSREGGEVTPREIFPDYVRMVTEKIQLDRPLRVVVDAGNGTASRFAPTILSAMGCEVIPLFCASDGTFPHHHPDPSQPENLAALQRLVRCTQADLGVAYDGDCDRLGVVDDQGRIVYPDLLMALFWQEILPQHPGAPALIEVKCSQALIDEVRRLGGKPLFCKTGHSLIKARMRELQAVFAGELSGHLFFADEYYGYDDAFYATARLLRLLAGSQQPLSSQVDRIPRYHSTPEVRVDCADERKATVVDAIRAHFAGRVPLDETDGVRIQFPGGWALVRASNTQPVLVLRAEGVLLADLQAICVHMQQAFAELAPDLGPIHWGSGA